MRYDWDIYDTALFGTTAGTSHTLFQNAQGSSGTYTKAFTSMRGGGQFPGTESFEIHKIGVYLDENAVVADEQDWFLQSYLEISVNNVDVFRASLNNLVMNNAFSGHYSQTTAANDSAIGKLGNGWELRLPIEVPGNTSFVVTLFQGTAVAGANTNVVVSLQGILTREN